MILGQHLVFTGTELLGVYAIPTFRLFANAPWSFAVHCGLFTFANVYGEQFSNFVLTKPVDKVTKS